MPALQVRELPEDLYEQLKESARRERRSLAQQTTVLLRRGLAAGEVSAAGDGEMWPERGGGSCCSSVGGVYSHADTIFERERRIAKRKELFRAIDETNRKAKKGRRRLTDAEIVAMIREDRDHGHNDDYTALLERI